MCDSTFEGCSTFGCSSALPSGLEWNLQLTEDVKCTLRTFLARKDIFEHRDGWQPNPSHTQLLVDTI